MPLTRALADSLNLATVHVGLDVGVKRIADTFARLGLEQAPDPNPSLILGGLDLAPIEVAQAMLYLASGWSDGITGQQVVLNLGEPPFA